MQRRRIRTRLDYYCDDLEPLADEVEGESNLDPLEFARADYVDWSDLDDLGLFDE